MTEEDKPSSLRMRVQRKLKMCGRRPALPPILVGGAVVLVAGVGL